jgi:nitrogen fixation NifU-like protein
MDDLRELYQETILDHNKAPRNFGALEDADRTARGDNPVCGDKLVVYLKLDDDDRVTDVCFEGKGCAISTASASLMTESVKGRTRAEIEETFEDFHELVTGNPSEVVDATELGKLAVFSGVREYPVRVKCATLSWHTLRSALDGSDDIARTE